MIRDFGKLPNVGSIAVSSFYASDFSRRYHLALVLGNADVRPIWEADRLDEFVAALDVLVATARGPAAGESCYFQLSGNRRKMVAYKFRNWRRAARTDGIFGLWEITAPSDAVCAREEAAPDVYANVSNEREVTMTDLRFNPAITLAIAADIPDARSKFDTVADTVAELTSAVLIAKKLRPWGMGTSIGYNNGISETSWFIGGLAGRDPTAQILYEPWDEVQTKVPKKPLGG